MTTKHSSPGVYGILCLHNRKLYIGSSENVERRIAEHQTQLRGKRHIQLPRLQHDWNKFGESAFAFIQFRCLPFQRDAYEQHLIETLQTLEHQLGYNKMLGCKWGVEASIRNTEAKLVRSGRFRRLPHVEVESPMTPSYIATQIR
ncbi:MAG: GIY-YIG nuclease family protein [Gammaproteobacteria bacterium]|nr:GIY-YIG nuclease family protein [Gammaproteobacteria bacterium]MBU1978901.1 GIY-YIG nuclease family protein [Gammaproteobacteria bacterium]